MVLLLLVFGNQSFGQFSPLTQSQAMAEMERFGSGKRVLYMAAHPDDENTRLIAWLSNALDAETTYLSLTRGSGGQNLIGDELGAELGVIREHELRAARSVDGGNQRFTDALDFGYSKSVDEVWTKWDHDDLQLQAVRTIRELKPDFIITRFPRQTSAPVTATTRPQPNWPSNVRRLLRTRSTIQKQQHGRCRAFGGIRPFGGTKP